MDWLSIAVAIAFGVAAFAAGVVTGLCIAARSIVLAVKAEKERMRKLTVEVADHAKL